MIQSSLTANNPETLQSLPQQELQDVLLEGVSRTFALTIPQLPKNLRFAVSNAYLLCRIVDTIEDEVSLSANQKQEFCSDFISVVKGESPSDAFAERLTPLLSQQTLPAEHTLIRFIPSVILITHQLETVQQEALTTCVETMAGGMPKFQNLNLHAGLKSMADMDNYCYFVAGCVGEMLAKLFCHEVPEIKDKQPELLVLAVSFGQGLQMTNILKDIWDDAKRDVCWLPKDIFDEVGYDLGKLSVKTNSEQFQLGVAHLIDIAILHLHNALEFTLMIPPREKGIRAFCLWALGMAVLTLRKIKHNLDFTASNQAKISRRSVKTTILATRLTGQSNTLLKLLFKLASSGLKTPDWQYQATQNN